MTEQDLRNTITAFIHARAEETGLRDAVTQASQALVEAASDVGLAYPGLTVSLGEARPWPQNGTTFVHLASKR